MLLEKTLILEMLAHLVLCVYVIKKWYKNATREVQSKSKAQDIKNKISSFDILAPLRHCTTILYLFTQCASVAQRKQV